MAKTEGERIKERIQRKKKKFRKPIVEEEIEIVRIIEEKQEEKEDLIKIRIVKEMVSKMFYKYLKVFKKKKSEKMLTRKTWVHTTDFKKGFVPKKDISVAITSFSLTTILHSSAY